MGLTLGLASILFYFSFSYATQSEMLDCNYATIQKFCDKIKATEKTQLNTKTPFQFSGKNADKSVSQMIPKDEIVNQQYVLNERKEKGEPLLSYKEHTRFKDLWRKTKKYAVESILQGRTRDEVSDHERNLLDRIEAIRLSDLKNPIDQDSCFKDYYYAYVPQTNSVVMCPVMAGYPDSALIWNMAAFMGRSLGSCIPRLLEPEINGKKVPKLTNATHPFRQFCTDQSCKPTGGLVACVKDGGYPDSTDLDTANPELNPTLDFIIKGMMNDKEYSLPVVKGATKDLIANPENREYAKKFMVDNRECYSTVTNSKTDAGVQDWFGADVVARYLEDHPIKAEKPEDYLQPVAAIADFSCRFSNAESLNKAFHAPNEIRFNSGIFTNPRLRKAMNCNPAKSIKKTCTVSTQFKKKVEASENSGPSLDSDGSQQ